MQRELMQQHGKHCKGSWCCPGHDKFPSETYANSRSKRARARDKKVEHQLARTIANRQMLKELK